MDAESAGASAFAAFVAAVTDTLTALPDDVMVRTFNDVSRKDDEDLLDWAARRAIESDYPLSPELLTYLMGNATQEVMAEIAELLLSLLRARGASPSYRFDDWRIQNQPRWLASGSAHSYARSILVAASVPLILASGWERPAQFPKFRGTPDYES